MFYQFYLLAYLFLQRQLAHCPSLTFNPLRGAWSPEKAGWYAWTMAALMLTDSGKAPDVPWKDHVELLAAVMLFIKERAPTESQSLWEIRRILHLSVDDFRAIARRMQDCSIPAVGRGAEIASALPSDHVLRQLLSRTDTMLLSWARPQVSAA